MPSIHQLLDLSHRECHRCHKRYPLDVVFPLAFYLVMINHLDNLALACGLHLRTMAYQLLHGDRIRGELHNLVRTLASTCLHTLLCSSSVCRFRINSALPGRRKLFTNIVKAVC